MVCKKDVVTWFKNLKSYKRVDVMCSLLQLCVPFELRFLGTCLEDLAKRDYQDLRQTETEANSLSELSSPRALTLADPETRTKLALYISLLHSCNDSCSDKIFKILTGDDVDSVLNLAATDNLVLEELLSIYTLVLNHPAFSFEHKNAVEKMFLKLQEEEPRLLEQSQKNKQPSFSHSLPDNIHERIQPPPIQSYQLSIDEGMQQCHGVTNTGPCPPMPPTHHPHAPKPYLPYGHYVIVGGETSDERRMGGWTGGIACDNALVMRPSSLSAPPCDPSGSPLMGARVGSMAPPCDQTSARSALPTCDPSGSPMMGTRVAALAAPCDQAGRAVPCDPATSPLMGSRLSSMEPVRTVNPSQADVQSGGSPMASPNSSPCQSPSRPSTPPRHRLPQNQSSSHSPPPRQTNHKDQTKDVPAPNVPIEQLSRMNDDELREAGLTQNAILQLRSLNTKHMSNGLPPSQPLIDFRKKQEKPLDSSYITVPHKDSKIS